MSTLSEIVDSIQENLQDDAYTSEILVKRVNAALQSIAAGIAMPDGEVSPPLPDLYTYGTVNTSITLPYTSLPTDYQRSVSNVYDASTNKILPPRGGDYYAFKRFLNQATKLDLSETGSIYLVCVKGSKVYYQGIPAVSTTIGLHYHRKPYVMSLDGDIPEGIPDHLQLDLLKHFVCMKIYGDIESGQYNKGIGANYHANQFFNLMMNLVDFVGIDAGPLYYGEDSFEDRGQCDG